MSLHSNTHHTFGMKAHTARQRQQEVSKHVVVSSEPWARLQPKTALHMECERPGANCPQSPVFTRGIVTMHF
jgi:hypothetical protein